jgi:hypothetical protein
MNDTNLNTWNKLHFWINYRDFKGYKERVILNSEMKFPSKPKGKQRRGKILKIIIAYFISFS